MSESEAEFLACGTAGAKASGKGSMVHLCKSGQVVLAGVQGRAGENARGLWRRMGADYAGPLGPGEDIWNLL